MQDTQVAFRTALTSAIQEQKLTKGCTRESMYTIALYWRRGVVVSGVRQ